MHRDWANVSNTPFREYKHWVHEGGISTPLIAHWPKGIAAARRNKFVTDPGYLIDLMATAVDLAGAKYPAASDGVKNVSDARCRSRSKILASPESVLGDEERDCNRGRRFGL